MQINHSEINAVVNAFHLPTLHTAVPLIPLVRSAGFGEYVLVKNLIKARVIHLEDIPQSANTVFDILKHGLDTWFHQRTKDLSVLQFSIDVLDKKHVEEIIAYSQDEVERQFTGNMCLALHGSEPRYFLLKQRANELEAIAPGVFSTALREIASVSPLAILTPNQLFGECSVRNWDEYGEVSKREARRSLKDRFGSDDDIESYMPDAVIPQFGGVLCLSDLKKKQKLHSMKSIAAIAKTHPEIAMVCHQICKLNEVSEIAKNAKASLPYLDGFRLTNTTFACSLVYEINDLTCQTVDDLVNDAWNCGDATEMMGIEEFPSSSQSLKQYFAKLHLAFNVVREMDALLAMISIQSDY